MLLLLPNTELVAPKALSSNTHVPLSGKQQGSRPTLHCADK